MRILADSNLQNGEQKESISEIMIRGKSIPVRTFIPSSHVFGLVQADCVGNNVVIYSSMRKCPIFRNMFKMIICVSGAAMMFIALMTIIVRFMRTKMRPAGAASRRAFAEWS